MTVRPSDWSALGLAYDPVPGDPQAVEEGAAGMRQVAATIEEAASNLRTIARSEGMESAAVEAFRKRAEEVATEIELAKDRYDRTGLALGAYAGPLREAQSWSVSALEQAEQARADVAERRQRVEDLHVQLQGAADPAGRAQVEDDLGLAYTLLGSAEDRMDEAHKLLTKAVGHRDDHAETAMGRIDDALEINGLDDSGWRQFLNKNAEFLDGLGKVLGAIGAGLAVVSLFVPGLNVLTMVGLGIGALGAGINGALAENGNKDWTDFAIDMLGLATLGVGKIGSVALRGMRAGRAAEVARNRAGLLAPARRPGVPRGGRAGNRAARRRARAGREAQRREYLEATTPPYRAQLRDFLSSDGYRRMWQAGRTNVQDNGLSTILRAGDADDAYQIRYYEALAAPGQGGGMPARMVRNADVLSGQLDNASTAFGAYHLVGAPNPAAGWVGDRIDAVVGDQPLQDDVGGAR